MCVCVLCKQLGFVVVSGTDCCMNKSLHCGRSNMVDLSSWKWIGADNAALVFMGDYVSWVFKSRKFSHRFRCHG